MIRLLALVISFGLQIVAASGAIRFMKITIYRLTWILLSSAFTLMAARKIIQLAELSSGGASEEMMVIDEWLGTLISVMIITGVILMREIFFSLKAAEADRSRAERRVLHAVITTEENERKRFAKDLHDGLGPLMSTVKMSLSALSGRITDPTGTEILSNTQRVVNEAIGTIKDISKNLSPHILSNFGLLSAANSFISKVNQTRVFNIELTSNINKERFNSDVEVVMYRALCELINNSIKHSGASKIDIDLNKQGNFLILHFSDNGRGFNKTENEMEGKMGMGLSNIITRVKSVDGIFVLDSSPGKGTQAFIKLEISDTDYTYNENG